MLFLGNGDAQEIQGNENKTIEEGTLAKHDKYVDKHNDDWYYVVNAFPGVSQIFSQRFWQVL